MNVRDDESDSSLSLEHALESESGNNYQVDLQSGEDDVEDNGMMSPPSLHQRYQSKRRSSVQSRQSSSRRSSGVISFEFHDSMVFEELSAMIDEEEEAAQGEKNDSADLLNKEITTGVGGLHDSASTAGSSSKFGLSRVSSGVSLDDDAPIVTRIERNIIGREIRAGNKLVRTRSDACFGDSARFPRTGSAMGLSLGSKSTSRLSRNRIASYATNNESQELNLSALQNASFATSGKNAFQANKSAASAGRSLLGSPSPSTATKNRSSKPSSSRRL